MTGCPFPASLQVAKSRSPAGDTTWMSDMVQLWQQLQGLPPAVHYTGA